MEGDAVFIGHPLVDAMPEADRDATVRIRAELDIPSDAQVMLLAPGSRQAEVSALLPLFDGALAMVSHRLLARGP